MRVIKPILSALLASAGVVALPTLVFQAPASAGEGGLAAGVSFGLDGAGSVLSVSAATAIGKTDALAVTFATSDGLVSSTSAAAYGASDAISLTGMDNVAGTLRFLDGLGGDASLGRAQANNFGQTFSVQIGTATGDSVVEFP
jgi:hypothetical protein